MTFTDFWHLITILGDFWGLAIILNSFIFYLIPSKPRKQKFVFNLVILILSFIVSGLFVELLKMSTQIPRPCVDDTDCPSGYSFPSGHATRVFVFSTVVALYTRNLGINLASIILAVLVSLSRVALNYHTYPDIIAGALIGFSVTYLVATLYNRKSSSIKAFKRIIS